MYPPFVFKIAFPPLKSKHKEFRKNLDRWYASMKRATVKPYNNGGTNGGIRSQIEPARLSTGSCLASSFSGPTGAIEASGTSFVVQPGSMRTRDSLVSWLPLRKGPHPVSDSAGAFFFLAFYGINSYNIAKSI
jgi:hypothetical protein